MNPSRSLLVAAGLSLVLAGGCGAPSKAPYPALGVTPDGDWEVYAGATAVTKASAGAVSVGHDTPEAAVMGFFASRVRGDEAWKSALSPRPSERLDRALAKYARWTFVSVKPLERMRHKPDAYWVKIEMTIEVDGKPDKGTDEAEATLIDGKWFVTGLPT